LNAMMGDSGTCVVVVVVVVVVARMA